ncbi:SIR2 family protein [uncultured Methanolobus sp.]|uniref:SIR2 family protein n=1 Tax=uncultured Methanolobus sp. TaxID=218300 RepID=UPI0029C84FD0|nr:SIR2 family protein [uncultured Methanolobus sp.]
MPRTYDDYIKDITDDIEKCLEDMKCQPILFVGSGLSKRYFKAPSWEELLIEMANKCPLIEKEFAYYKQNAKKDVNGNGFVDIGTTFAEYYKEWAWGEGRSEFPDELFSEEKSPDIYFKYKVAEHLELLLKKGFIDQSEQHDYNEEIELIAKIKPHAIITTNYDQLLEQMFSEYEPIVGQKILRGNFTNYGEIFKIHGCISNPDGMILTQDDYDEFIKKKKYLSAKLLIFFAEHPLLFIGYSAEDPNIKLILSDIDEIISMQGETIPNIYILEWDPDIDVSKYPVSDKIISIGNSKSIRIKCIVTSSFKWVFEAFSSNDEIQNIDVKILRSLLARNYELVRSDIPRSELKVNYETLEHVVNGKEGLATLYGISILDNPEHLNAFYPYTLTQISEKLGFLNIEGNGIWQKSYPLIEKIINEKGVDIRESDNIFHINIRTGTVSNTHKYSDSTVSLLEKVRDGEDYSEEIGQIQ